MRGVLPAIVILFSMIPVAAIGTSIDSNCIDEPIFEGEVCVYEANTGAEQAVVLVHGIGGSAVFDWEYLIPILAERYHVVALDLPGFGDSSKASRRYTPTRYAHLLRFVTERYIKTPFSLVGHSLGGAVALRYAALYPDGLDRMVLANAAGILHGLALSKHLAGGWTERMGFPEAAGWVERLTGKILEEVERLPMSPDDWMNSGPHRGEELNGDASRVAAMELAQEDFSAPIGMIEIPTLVIWGDSDRIAPLRTGIVLSRRMQNARLVQMENTGHASMREAPRRFNRLVSDFLEKPLTKKGREPEPITSVDSERVGRCENRSGMTFEGHYRRIELRHCKGVTIKASTVGRISLFESRVDIIDSQVLSSSTALTAEGSYVRATATTFRGETAIAASRSRFDLAGVSLIGKRAAVEAKRSSKFIFSVCDISSGTNKGHLHGFRNLKAESL
ncbi:alpha/beta fold hydrolase [Thiohalomonas denitrificans]|uniref:alpha/beta fold hydrolase n=1 Tax=Thiohalomonas denitrificans TaxID=415747 RepID=UPI0026EFCD90|nr:alpha/beta hydrolase [Thiohalomonas denitrificans]